MNMPFYVAPEQLMKDRADFAQKGIARGRSLAAVEFDEGVLLCAENPSRNLRKVSEIYDRIAFAGVGFIAGEPRLQGQYLAFGFVLAAAAMWSVANLQVKLLGKVDGMMLIAWTAAFAAPQLLIASLLLEDGQLEALAAADWRAFASVAYQAAFVVVLGYGVWYWLLQRYDVNQAMPFTLLVPPFAVAAAILFLDETLTLPMLLGGVMTILGVGIIVLRRPRTTAPETERL